MDSNKYSLLNIFKSSFDFFSKNFSQLVNIMLPSILMQTLGIFISLTPAQYLNAAAKGTAQDMSIYLIPVFLCAIIGLTLFASGFWKYMLITYQMVLASNDYDDSNPLNFKSYENEISGRQNDYIKMLLWTTFYVFMGIFGTFLFFFVSGIFRNPFGAIIAIFIELGVIVWLTIKSSLVTQVFAFKKDIAPKDILRGSFEFSKGHEGGIFIALAILFLIAIVVQVLISAISVPISLIAGGNIALANLINYFLGALALFLLPFNIAVITLFYKRIKLNEKM